MMSIRGRNFFLTIPHFDCLEETYQKLESQAKEFKIEHFAVVKEPHQNDDFHLHVFVSFTNPREIGANYFDWLGKHGHLERVRNIEAVLSYMDKTHELKANFDIWEKFLTKNFTRTVIQMIAKGWDQEGIMLAYADKIPGNKPWHSAFRLAIRYEEAKAVVQAKAEKVRYREITPALIEQQLDEKELQTFYSDTQFQTFVNFVNNCLKYGNMHPYKECCVAIVGQPSIGKSTVARALARGFATYNFPLDGWHSQYRNGIYELIVWNEWDIRLIGRSDLLLFTEGEIVDLKVKYTKAIKKDRPLILLTSNYHYLKQVRRKFAYDPEQRNIVSKALAVRIVELDFRDQPIWFLTKLLVPEDLVLK